jgi:hypothetical protein
MLDVNGRTNEMMAEINFVKEVVAHRMTIQNVMMILNKHWE